MAGWIFQLFILPHLLLSSHNHNLSWARSRDISNFLCWEFHKFMSHKCKWEWNEEWGLELVKTSGVVSYVMTAHMWSEVETIQSTAAVSSVCVIAFLILFLFFHALISFSLSPSSSLEFGASASTLWILWLVIGHPTILTTSVSFDLPILLVLLKWCRPLTILLTTGLFQHLIKFQQW